VHNQVEPLLLNLLEPLGDEGVQVAEQILGFVSNIEVKVLGAVGLGVLVYTVASLIHKMTRAIDFTWNGGGERSLAQRLGIYMLMIMLGPLILFSVAGAISNAVAVPVVQNLLSVHLIGSVYHLILEWVPFMLVTIMLTLVYWILPGKTVRWYNALAGGILAALLWKLLGWIFAVVVVGSAKYTAIYSAFASALLFMIWLHLSWLVMLLGSRFVYYLEHPESMRPASLGMKAADPRHLLEILYWVTSAFYREGGGVTAQQLARLTGYPGEFVLLQLQPLEQAGLLAITGQPPAAYLPARSPDQIKLADVLALVHHWRQGTEDRLGAGVPIVEALLARLDKVVGGELDDETLESWVMPDLSACSSPKKGKNQSTGS
ncbi:MAG TPA: YihY family inner membrane protein, partial [Gammaproteobacteria bacterium]|nr:YihY family inner membrane protein [Gammaproteobacteria bacterium]